MKNRLISACLTASLLLALTGCSQGSTDTSSTSEAETASTTASADVEPDTSAPDIWNPEIAQRQEELNDTYLCGVVLIGYVDSEATPADCKEILLDSDYTADFEFIADIPDANCIDAGHGNELYLIIPQDPEASVTVNEWLLTEENEFMGEPGAEYYHSDTGAPILLKCNFSDIMPSAVITITESNGDSLQWCPSISMKDGSVSRYGVEDIVLDMTHYHYNETYEAYQIIQ